MWYDKIAIYLLLFNFIESKCFLRSTKYYNTLVPISTSEYMINVIINLQNRELR